MTLKLKIGDITKNRRAMALLKNHQPKERILEVNKLDNGNIEIVSVSPSVLEKSKSLSELNSPEVEDVLKSVPEYFKISDKYN